jgi:hypothetical protein
MTDVDDIDGYTDEDPLVLPARLGREESYTPWWAGLLAPIQVFVEMLPSHKSTRKGRKSAKQFRVVLGAVTFAAIVFSPAEWVTIAAILVMITIVPWLPLPQVRKRAMVNRVKNLRRPRTHTVTRPARIIYDGRRVKLDKGGNTLRRVLTDREEHRFRTGTCDGRLFLEIAPESGKKSEAIWVGTDDLAPGELDEDLATFLPGDVDRPVLVDGRDWRSLLGVIRALED